MYLAPIVILHHFMHKHVRFTIPFTATLVQHEECCTVKALDESEYCSKVCLCVCYLRALLLHLSTVQSVATLTWQLVRKGSSTQLSAFTNKSLLVHPQQYSSILKRRLSHNWDYALFYSLLLLAYINTLDCLDGNISSTAWV